MSRLWKLFVAGLLCCPVVVAPAAAQPVPPVPGPVQGGPSSDGAPPPASRSHPFIEDFRAANTTHDGRLTLQQAQAAAGTVPHMTAVVRHFAEVDVQHKGFITIQDIRAYMQRRRAARAAAEPVSPD